MAEHLTCNEDDAGSNPVAGPWNIVNRGERMILWNEYRGRLRFEPFVKARLLLHKIFLRMSIRSASSSEHCQVCGKGYLTIYSVPDEVWKKITPKSGEAGVLCIECADRISRELGIDLYWSAGIGEYPGD